MKKALFVVLISVLFFSCKKENKIENIERAFYYWKSENGLRDQSLDFNKLKVKKLYVKYFEIDYSEAMGNYPYDKSEVNKYGRDKYDSLVIVPTIYIRNEIFKFNKEKDLDKLADNIVYLVNKYNKERFEKFNLANEIQIDCDWTKSTKEKYFYLLKRIKTLSKRNLSCTLRLYPYKYRDEMGIPPVDRVTLMCYNLIKPLSTGDKNSILDLKELKSYLNERRDYPLELDVALPIYGWTLWYQNNKFTDLLTIGSKEIKSFAKEIKPMWYEAVKDTSLNYSAYFRKGDRFKCEEVNAALINSAIQVIKKNVILKNGCTIALFHLDENTVKQYSDEEINDFYTAFTKQR